MSKYSLQDRITFASIGHIRHNDHGIEFVEITPTAIKQLIRDFIEEVKPERLDTDGSQGKWVNGVNDTIEMLEANVREVGL